VGIWELVYFVCIYLAVALCLVSVIKIGAKDGWFFGLIELLILVGFAGAYWLLESYALHLAPFYVYPPVFPDMVPLHDFSGFPGLPGIPPTHVCNQPATTEISLTVPFLEMSMTYCLMWTARLLLKPHGWFNSFHATAVAPFIVGLMALALDGYLDPVFAETFHCSPVVLNHPGMGFWMWFTSPDMANIWYGIPMYNFGAWFAAPVILVTLVLLIRWLYEVFLYLRGVFFGPPSPLPSVVTGLIQFAILLAFLALYLTSPGASPPYLQVLIMVATIIISLAIVVARIGTYYRNNPFRFEFVVPLALVFLMPIPMLIISGTFDLAKEWPLLLGAIAFAVIGIIFALSPYSGSWLFPSMAPPNPSRNPVGPAGPKGPGPVNVPGSNPGNTH
jgi:hypothetical protein